MKGQKDRRTDRIALAITVHCEQCRHALKTLPGKSFVSKVFHFGFRLISNTTWYTSEHCDSKTN